MFKIQLQDSRFATNLSTHSLVKTLLYSTEKAVDSLFFYFTTINKRTFAQLYNAVANDPVKRMLITNHMINTIQYNNRWHGDPLTPYNCGHLVPTIYVNAGCTDTMYVEWTVSDPLTTLLIVYQIQQNQNKSSIANTTLNDIKW